MLFPGCFCLNLSHIMLRGSTFGTTKPVGAPSHRYAVKTALPPVDTFIL